MLSRLVITGRGKEEEELQNEELDEADVWSCCFLPNVDDSNSTTKNLIYSGSSPGVIPGTNAEFEFLGDRRSSEPTAVPYRRSSASKAEGGEDDIDGEMMPPHEWIARNHPRNESCSSSMREGIGRTLKGRDVRSLRNAVLAKTGFLD